MITGPKYLHGGHLLFFVVVFYCLVVALHILGASKAPKNFSVEPVFIEYKLPEVDFIAPKEYKEVVQEISTAYNLDPKIFSALVYVESRWDPDAIGYNGDSIDYGLGQINSRYEEWYVGYFGFYQYEREDPYHNLELSAMILNWCFTNTSSVKDGIMAYNCGLSAVRKGRIPDSTKKYYANIIAYIENQ